MNKVISPVQLDEQIGEALMEKFGYVKKVSTKNKPITVQGFETLTTKQKIPYMRKQIQQVEASLYSNQKEKQFFPEYTKLAQRKIRQYNHIVSFKHIIQKNSKQTRQLLKKPNRTEQQDIFQKIEQLKKDLVKKQNVKDNTKQYILNKTLNGLFRKFQSTTLQKSKSKNNVKEVKESDKNMLKKRMFSTIDQIQRLNSNINDNTIQSEHISNTSRAHKIVFQYRKEKVKQPKLLEPFSNDDSQKYHQSKKVEIKIKNQRQVIDLWKLRIQEVKQKNRNNINTVQPEFSPARVNQTANTSRKTKDLSKEENINLIDYSQEIEDIDIEQIGQKAKKKKLIFTEVMRKRNNRFVKPRGTKILIKFDPEKAAKNLLEGHPSGYEVSPTKLKSNRKEEDTYQLSTLQGPPKKLPSKSDYTIEYKNQKINSSIKPKKHIK